MLIYKVFRSPEWAEFETAGSTFGAPVDLQDGFVHLSTGAQLRETLRRHFAGEAGLVLIAIDSTAAGSALRWEPSRGDDLFPHLYRPLAMEDVVWSRSLDDVEELPAEVA